MPMQNSLNVSELLKRIGVVGDSQGSATLLDEMRMIVKVADLSALVPPVGTPIAIVSSANTSGIGTFNQWTLRAGSAGGLRVTGMQIDATNQDFRVSITDADPFANSAAVPHFDFAFQNPAQSIFFANTPNEATQLGQAPILQSPDLDRLLQFGNWVGPGQFFNIEATVLNTVQRIAVSWVEYPGAINP